MLADLLSFFVRQRLASAEPLPVIPTFLTIATRVFAVEVEFFSERVNACGHGVNILSIRWEPAARI